MMLPRLGDRYPVPAVGPHAGHTARIVALDLHGQPSWEDDPFVAPTITVRCECGTEWVDDLIEVAAVPSALGIRRTSVA